MCLRVVTYTLLAHGFVMPLLCLNILHVFLGDLMTVNTSIKLACDGQLVSIRQQHASDGILATISLKICPLLPCVRFWWQYYGARTRTIWQRISAGTIEARRQNLETRVLSIFRFVVANRKVCKIYCLSL